MKTEKKNRISWFFFFWKCLPPSSSESDMNVSCIDSGAITLYLVVSVIAPPGEPFDPGTLFSDSAGPVLVIFVSVTTLSVSTTVM